MTTLLGVDTLCYHCRIAAGEITVAEVVRECSSLGADFVQLNDVHIRNWTPASLGELRTLADDLGVGLTLAGDIIGLAARGDSVAHGVGRLEGWSAVAETIGSPFVRTSSGFYRADVWREPDLIRTEQEYVTGVLADAAARNSSGIRILLENHSDFTPEEYAQIISSVASPKVGVFLDLINPISVLAEPLPIVTLLRGWASAGHIKDFRLVSNYVEDRQHRRGFEVQWCYPGEGVADLAPLVDVVTAGVADGDTYHLSIEGLDNRAGVADQAERLTSAMALTRDLLAGSHAAATH